MIDMIEIEESIWTMPWMAFYDLEREPWFLFQVLECDLYKVEKVDRVENYYYVGVKCRTCYCTFDMPVSDRLGEGHKVFGFYVKLMESFVKVHIYGKVNRFLCEVAK